MAQGKLGPGKLGPGQLGPGQLGPGQLGPRALPFFFDLPIFLLIFPLFSFDLPLSSFSPQLLLIFPSASLPPSITDFLNLNLSIFIFRNLISLLPPHLQNSKNKPRSIKHWENDANCSLGTRFLRWMEFHSSTYLTGETSKYKSPSHKIFEKFDKKKAKICNCSNHTPRIALSVP